MHNLYLYVDVCLFFTYLMICVVVALWFGLWCVWERWRSSTDAYNRFYRSYEQYDRFVSVFLSPSLLFIYFCFFFSAIIDVVFGGQIKERKEKKHRKGDGGRRKGGGRSAGVIDFFWFQLVPLNGNFFLFSVALSYILLVFGYTMFLALFFLLILLFFFFFVW